MKRDPKLSKELLGGIDPEYIRVTNLDNFVLLSKVKTNSAIKLTASEGLKVSTNALIPNVKKADRHGAIKKDDGGSHKSTLTRKRRFSVTTGVSSGINTSASIESVPMSTKSVVETEPQNFDLCSKAKRAKWDARKIKALSDIVEENDACMNGNIDWIEVKESFENEFPGYSKTQLKNQYHSMKKRSVFEVTSNSRQVSSAPSLSSSQEISASFNTSSSSTEVTTLTTASVSRSSLPFPTSKVASQNNSTYSLAEIRNTSLDVPTKGQQFSLLEKKIFQDLIGSKKFHDKNHKIRWLKGGSNTTGFVEAWLKQCKIERLNNSSCLVYERTRDQLKEYYRNTKFYRV
jgi:hypothetical protein